MKNKIYLLKKSYIRSVGISIDVLNIICYDNKYVKVQESGNGSKFHIQTIGPTLLGYIPGMYCICMYLINYIFEKIYV